MQGSGRPRWEACLCWDGYQAMRQGELMDLSHVLAKAMALYKHAQEIENAVADLLNEVQMLITTKAHADEIEIEEK